MRSSLAHPLAEVPAARLLGGVWQTLMAAMVVILLSLTGRSAADERVDVDVSLEQDYGRMVINFADRNLLPKHRISSTNGVLVIYFDDPADLDVGAVPITLARFVTIARTDPEGHGARFALARSVKVNTMEAGGRLFVDFLPMDWQGPPPQLPMSVVEELALRAEEAALRAKQAEMQKTVGTKQAKIDVSVARAPTFSRFVFRWNVPFEATFSREGAGISVAFNRQSKVDLSEIAASLPPFVDDVSSREDDTGLTIQIAVQPIADVRAYKEENTYIVDVQGPIDETALAPLDAAVHKAAGGAGDHQIGTDHVSAPGSGDAGHGDAHAAPDAHADPHATADAGHGNAHAAPDAHADPHATADAGHGEAAAAPDAHADPHATADAGHGDAPMSMDAPADPHATADAGHGDAVAPDAHADPHATADVAHGDAAAAPDAHADPHATADAGHGDVPVSMDAHAIPADHGADAGHDTASAHQLTDALLADARGGAADHAADGAGDHAAPGDHGLPVLTDELLAGARNGFDAPAHPETATAHDVPDAASGHDVAAALDDLAGAAPSGAHGDTSHDQVASHAQEPPVADHAPDRSQLAELPEGNDRILADDTIRVESKRVGRSTRLVFPYKSPVAAAMFNRGPALWMVFNNPAPIDLAPLQDAMAGYARSIEVIKAGKAIALRIDMAEPLLASMNADGNRWVVTFGDMVMQPTRPLPIKRLIRENGEAVLDIPFGPVAAVHDFVDPSVGDHLLVVSALGEPRGLIKSQSFAEVDALASAHGLAFVPRTDDIELSVANEVVTIQRPGGLAVSTTPPQRQVGVLDLPGALGSSLSARAGFVDYAGMEATAPSEYWKKRHEVFGLIAQTRDKGERVDRWYKAARFNIANGLGPEAMGILDLVGSLAPEEATSERMASLKAAASTLMYRPKDVLMALDRPEFADSPDAAVWRSIALTDLGKFADARKNAPRAESVIGGFPTPIQKRFLLAAVTSAIELNDYGRAASLLAEIDPKTLSEEEHGRLDLLSARAADSSGHTDDAIELLSNIVRTRNGPVAAEATLRLIHLQRREGVITLDQALDRLEQLAVSWRGDDIELNTLRTIGQYSVEKGDYRRAFEVKRTAEAINPNSDTTRVVQDEAQAAFAALYIDGGADQMKPVDALALYYDFRELTPPGRRGDTMVRNLANRLVDVDLLPQAAKLLDYQIENRLRGAARAETAADLGLIYLMDKHPEKALLTLSRTRQAELPATIERQRRTVEARALADTGKVDLALDLLKPLTGGDIERMRADILWNAKRYAEAGDIIEKQLGNRWNESLPLSDVEQLAVLKAGIAFSLNDDRVSLDRLRSKYASKMAESANAVAFEAVTGPIVTDGATLEDVVRSIANIDTMQNFVNDYRARYGTEKAPNEPAIVDQSAQTDGTPAAAPANG